MTFADISERDKLIMDWQEAERMLAAAKETELTLRKRVFDLCFPNAEVGTNTLELGKGYKIKAVRKLNYNLANGAGETERALEAIAKLGNRGEYIAADLVSWKPSLSLTTMKKLEKTNREDSTILKLIESVLTVTDATPTLEVVVPKAK